jgi:hypothetical protein
VAYGALGTPIIALAGVTGLTSISSGHGGRQLPFFSLIVPFWGRVGFAGSRNAGIRRPHSPPELLSPFHSRFHLSRPLAGGHVAADCVHGCRVGAVEILATEGQLETR